MTWKKHIFMVHLYINRRMSLGFFQKRNEESIRKSTFGNFNGGTHLQVLGV
jgi:hypothetical protein